MKTPVPTLSNPNFAEPNKMAAGRAPQSSNGIVAAVVAESAANERIRRMGAIRMLEHRYAAVKEQILQLCPAENIPAFGGIDDIDGLKPSDLKELESASGAMVAQIEARAQEIERERAENMTEVVRLWSAINALTTQCNAMAHRLAKLEGGGQLSPTAQAAIAKAAVPQLLQPKRGSATAEAFGGPRESGVRRIG
jgi:hypothetical protein